MGVGKLVGGGLSVGAGGGTDLVRSELSVRSTIKLLISWVLFYTGNGLLVLGCNLSWNF